MSNGTAQNLWSRRPPEITGPDRTAGGVYQTAEGKDGTGGIPLNTANDAIVAAVRLAYKVAETQIERSTRLADRLRQAGDRAIGPDSDRKALDAAEKLVVNALMSGLSWWEGSVAEGRCPVKRLAAAEYQMLGSLLGFTPFAHGRDKTAGKHDPDPAGRDADRGAAPYTRVEPAPRRQRVLQIVHRSDRKARRPVLIKRWEFAGEAGVDTDIYFYSGSDPNAAPLDLAARLVVGSKGGDARLMLTTPQKIVPGRWRAVVCDDEGVQVGFIEMLL